MEVSHENLTQLFRSTIDHIIKEEPLLNDLHSNITLEEVDNQLSFEHGDSMILYIQRADNQVMNIIVRQNATLKDLKFAIKRFILLRHSRTNNTTVLSWGKYVWKRYCLCFDNHMLTDDGKLLKDYGIFNKSQLCFSKKAN